jgi:hypothetical protein
MPFAIPNSHKFSCFALEAVGLERDFSDPLDLGGGLWVAFNSPFQLDGAWRDWLGSLESDRLLRCNLTLLAMTNSGQPQILDDENRKLSEQALSLIYALFLTEVFRFGGGIGLSGANVEGAIQIRQTSRLEKFYIPLGAKAAVLNRDHFLRMNRIAEGIRAVHQGGTPTRLQKGFHACVRGWQEYYGDERLHQFVRALEAITKPVEGKVKRQFVHRCQLFTGESAANEILLKELVNMRGSAEHLNPLEGALSSYSEDRRETVARQRSFQAQLLTSHVYEHIFSDAEVRAVFSDENRIGAFWQLSRRDQVAQWGRQINLQEITAARFDSPRVVS